MARIVDPRFGARLRQLRQDQGWSLRDLATEAYLSKSQISEYENGRRRPSVDMAETLDRALGADGALAALVIETNPTDRDDPAGTAGADRVAYAAASPARVDEAAVTHLGDMLQRQRHLDDFLPADLLLPAVESELTLVLHLAREARGPHAAAVQLVAAEWMQFAGWMNSQTRRDARAAQLLSTAARDALDLGAPDVASQAHNFRGALERRRNNPRGIVRWFMAAYETPGISDLHRIDAAVQAVHGLGLLGEHREASELLTRAENLADLVDARGQGAHPTAYWLTSDWLRLPIGLAHLGLGNHGVAADSLQHGLDSLPADWQQASWAREYRDALELADSRR